MNNLEQIQSRKAALLAVCDEQREQIAFIYERVQQPVAMGTRAIRMFKSPLFLTGLAALLVRTRWRRFAKVPGWIWKGWRLVQIWKTFSGLRM
jgi:hypothetical protein